MEHHWENSSSNAIVQDLIEKAMEATKMEIEARIPELTYTDLDSEDGDTCNGIQ